MRTKLTGMTSRVGWAALVAAVAMAVGACGSRSDDGQLALDTSAEDSGTTTTTGPEDEGPGGLEQRVPQDDDSASDDSDSAASSTEPEDAGSAPSDNCGDRNFIVKDRPATPVDDPSTPSDDPSDGDDPCATSEEEIPLGTGDVQITLRWNSNADFDLHVTEPDGTEIWYLEPGPTSSGGQLDVDSNVDCIEDGSVENVFWPSETGPPAGEYTVEVNGYTAAPTPECGPGDYELTIMVAGAEPQVFTGTVAQDESDSYPFTVPD